MSITTYFFVDSMEQETHALARGLRRRDPDLLDRLIEQCHYRLFRYLVYLTGSRETAEDLFQEAQVVVQAANASTNFSELPRSWAPLALFGIVTGVSVVLACLIFLFAYINRDAKRRGMSPTLWTLVAIFVSYLIGVMLYFILREPLAFNCPRCGLTVNARYNYCPACACNLRPTCPQCKREVREGDRFCPHFAYQLAVTTS